MHTPFNFAPNRFPHRETAISKPPAPRGETPCSSLEVIVAFFQYRALREKHKNNDTTNAEANDMDGEVVVSTTPTKKRGQSPRRLTLIRPPSFGVMFFSKPECVRTPFVSDPRLPT